MVPRRNGSPDQMARLDTWLSNFVGSDCRGADDHNHRRCAPPRCLKSETQGPVGAKKNSRVPFLGVPKDYINIKDPVYWF